MRDSLSPADVGREVFCSSNVRSLLEESERRRRNGEVPEDLLCQCKAVLEIQWYAEHFEEDDDCIEDSIDAAREVVARVTVARLREAAREAIRRINARVKEMRRQRRNAGRLFE